MYFSAVNDARETKYAEFLQAFQKAQQIIERQEEELSELTRRPVIGFNNFLKTEASQ